MLNLIQQLQRKPERVRKQLAFVGSLVLTGTIVLFWLVSLATREPASVTREEVDLGPLKTLSGGAETLWADAKNTWQQASALFSNVAASVNQREEK